MYRLFPTMQFVLVALATMCATIVFGYHIVNGNCKLFVAILLIGVWFVIHGLTRKAWRDMVKCYREDEVSPELNEGK